jgi:hypothetical protein
MSTKAATTFQRQVWLFAAGLAGLCLILMLLTWLQGARVRSATIDVAKATRQGGQRLLLQLNQSPGTINAKDISITPSASFSATSGGKTIALQFTQPLRNETTYKLRISAANGRNINYSFTTGAVSFFYVVHVTGGSDLHERWLGTNKDSVVLSTEPIDDYIVVGSTIIYTVNDKAGRGSLRLYNPATREHNELILPEDGTVETLSAAPDGKSFGFLFMASNYRSENSNTIVIYSSSGDAFKQVEGFDNKPFRAIGWQFARNGKTIAALGIDQTLFLINPGSPPTPFGQYDSIEGFTYDDSGILVSNRAAGKEIIDLKSGQRSPVPQLSADSYLLTATPLNAEPGSMFRVQSYKGTESTGKVVINRGKISKQMYSAEPDKGYIAFNVLSPNDQYVAIELRDANTETNAIEIVDTWSDRVITKLSGDKVRWATGL